MRPQIFENQLSEFFYTVEKIAKRRYRIFFNFRSPLTFSLVKHNLD